MGARGEGSPWTVKVMKFGGSSLRNQPAFQRVAAFVADAVDDGSKVALVVSASGDHTDDLVQRLQMWAPDACHREYDAFVSLGEVHSAALMAACLSSAGLSAKSLNAYQAGIQVTQHFKNARLVSMDDARLREHFKDSDVLVIPGFQGVTPDGSIATIGRGGSDTSAVAVASVLDAGVCSILTDVKGIYTCHPHKLPGAVPIVIPQISYREVCEMASLGAKVIHPRAVQIAAKHQILIRIAHSASPASDVQTLIGPFRSPQQNPVTAACIDDNIALLTFSSIDEKNGDLARIVHTFLTANITVTLVVHNMTTTGPTPVDIVVPADEVEGAIAALRDRSGELVCELPTVQRKLAVLSIVGEGMQNRVGTAAEFLKVVEQCGVNIRLLAGSSLSQSVLVSRDDALAVYEAVCKHFDLVHRRPKRQPTGREKR